MSAADRAIRVSTAAAVVGVAGIAAYVSYWHAFEVVRAHGERGLTARLEPATIDGLVYASSMVVLYAARHQLALPGLARWLLALGIVATLAANVAHGWVHGPVGAVVAAWPAASLVGSYESCCGLSGPRRWCCGPRTDCGPGRRSSGPPGHWGAAGVGARPGHRGIGAHLSITPGPADRVIVALARFLVRAGPAGQVGPTRAIRSGPWPRRRSIGPW